MCVHSFILVQCICISHRPTCRQTDQRFPRHCTMMFTTYHIDDIIFSCTYIRFEVLFLTTDKLRDLIITKFSNAYVNREAFWLQILVHVHVVNREATDTCTCTCSVYLVLCAGGVVYNVWNFYLTLAKSYIRSCQKIYTSIML